MRNGERADRFFADAERIAAEVRRAVDDAAWNLVVRRAQEVVELVVKALLTQMTIDYPKTHDPAPALVEAMRRRGLDQDPAFLERLLELSARLERLRSPAFYQEIIVPEAEARELATGATEVLAVGRRLLARLRQA